jgi:hypothetical protein
MSMSPENQTGNVTNFCGAISNVARDMVAAGVPADQLAAGLRIEAGKVEAKAVAAAPAIGPEAEQEAAALIRKAHEYINALQVAGMSEITIVTAHLLALVERMTRKVGVDGAATWLEGMAKAARDMGDGLEQTARHH